MSKPVFLVAGGTGGHVFPALALAEILLERGHQVEFMTDTRGQRYFQGTNLTPHIISSATFRGDWKEKAISGAKIAYGMLQSLELCREFGPGVVVGFGGYPSFPTVSAAQFLKIPTVLHEQNAVFGRANRRVAERAAFIATSFEETKNLNLADKNKIVVTGNPIRNAFLGDYPYDAPATDKPFHLLVCGGSQGSSVFSDVIPAAIEKLDPELRNRLIITQQCRKEDLDNVTKIYNGISISARLQPFFTDMPALYAKSHLVIARAGASTVAEITAFGRPALFVPLAASLDGDQSQNAQRLMAQKAAWLLEEKDFTPDSLAAKLTALLQNPEPLKEAAEEAKRLGKQDAAVRLADLVTAAMK